MVAAPRGFDACNYTQLDALNPLTPTVSAEVRFRRRAPRNFCYRRPILIAIAGRGGSPGSSGVCDHTHLDALNPLTLTVSADVRFRRRAPLSFCHRRPILIAIVGSGGRSDEL